MKKIKQNNKNLENSKYINSNVFIALLFILSGTAYTYALSIENATLYSYISIGISILFLTIIAYKYVMNMKFEIKRLIISILVSFYYYSELSVYFDSVKYKVLFGIASFAGAIGTYIFIDKVFPKIINFFKNLSKNEKIYMILIIILGIGMCHLLTGLTTAFTMPKYNDVYYYYDSIYKADNGAITIADAFINPLHGENDIRQPLFAVVSIPFAILARFISYFIIISRTGYKYAIGMGIIQYILLGISTILIGRMLKLGEEYKPYYYLLTSVSFSYLIFSNIIEQYVIVLFYLILTCYLFFNNKEKINYAYIGAVGTLITSGIIFPIISESKKIKDKIIDIFKCFIAFVGVSSISCKLPILLNGPKTIGMLIGNFGGKTSYNIRLYQFTNFIENIFVTPKGNIVMHTNPEYVLKDFTSISIIGIIILILCILGYIFSRKNKFNLFCLLWMLFSFVLLFISGWGSGENCLILYSLYFGFSYITLLFNFFKGIFNNKKTFKIVISILCLLILCFNIITIVDILKFAIKFY